MRRSLLPFILVLLTSCSQAPPDNAFVEETDRPSETATPASEPAPDFTLSTLEGQEFTLSEHAGTRPVVLNFWAEWCPQCRAEQPAINEVARDYAEDVLFFGVAWQSTESGMRDYVEEFDVPYATGLDESREIFADFGVNYQPATVFITQAGEVWESHAGIITESDLRTAVEELIEA